MAKKRNEQDITRIQLRSLKRRIATLKARMVRERAAMLKKVTALQVAVKQLKKRPKPIDHSDW